MLPNNTGKGVQPPNHISRPSSRALKNIQLLNAGTIPNGIPNVPINNNTIKRSQSWNPKQTGDDLPNPSHSLSATSPTPKHRARILTVFI